MKVEKICLFFLDGGLRGCDMSFVCCVLHFVLVQFISYEVVNSFVWFFLFFLCGGYIRFLSFNLKLWGVLFF